MLTNAVYSQGNADPASANRAWTGMEHADIRFDEDYARFYEAYSGQRKLPPPVEGRTLYSELGLLQQKQMLAQQQGLLTSATPPPSQSALLMNALTPGGEVSHFCCSLHLQHVLFCITLSVGYIVFTGLEVIQEQGPNNGLVQAFQQLCEYLAPVETSSKQC